MNIDKDKWADVLAFVKEQYDVTDVAYRVWLEPLSVSEQQLDGAVTVLVPNDPPHAYEYVKSKFSGALEEAFREVTGEDVKLNFGVRIYVNAGH